MLLITNIMLPIHWPTPANLRIHKLQQTLCFRSNVITRACSNEIQKLNQKVESLAFVSSSLFPRNCYLRRVGVAHFRGYIANVGNTISLTQLIIRLLIPRASSRINIASAMEDGLGRAIGLTRKRRFRS